MSIKTTILDTLGRDELKSIIDDMGVDDVDRRSVDATRNDLSRLRSVPAEVVPELQERELPNAKEPLKQ